jgi:hypothetical protein
MQTNNSTAAGFANDTIKQKCSKAIDMRFYWTKDCIRQGQFLIYWRPGPKNLGDYHTKHFSPRVIIASYDQHTYSPAFRFLNNVLQGCVNSSNAHIRTSRESPQPRH